MQRAKFTGKPLKTELEHQQALELMIDSFYTMHPLWRIMPPDITDARNILSYKIKEANKRDLAWGFFLGNRLIAVALMFHLDEYLSHSPPKNTSSKLFDIYEPYFHELQMTVAGYLKPNRLTYFSDYIAVKPEYAAKGYGILTYLEAFEMGKRNGCDDIFARMTNPINRHIAQSLGFAVVKELTMHEDMLKGRAIQLLYMSDVKGFNSTPTHDRPRL